MTAVLDIIKMRRSIRSYSSETLSTETIGRLMNAMRFAPSACNNQPWRFIMITDPAVRSRTAALCQGQKWIAEAPLVVVACAMPGEAYGKMGGAGNSGEIDAAIAMDHLALAAADEELGTCWIGAFDEKALKAFLNVPENVRIVVLMPVGYPKDREELREPGEKTRKSPSAIFFKNKWPD